MTETNYAFILPVEGDREWKAFLQLFEGRGYKNFTQIQNASGYGLKRVWIKRATKGKLSDRHWQKWERLYFVTSESEKAAETAFAKLEDWQKKLKELWAMGYRTECPATHYCNHFNADGTPKNARVPVAEPRKRTVTTQPTRRGSLVDADGQRVDPRRFTGNQWRFSGPSKKVAKPTIAFNPLPAPARPALWKFYVAPAPKVTKKKTKQMARAAQKAVKMTAVQEKVQAMRKAAAEYHAAKKNAKAGAEATPKYSNDPNELRMDDDGYYYTKSQFRRHYGGYAEWDAAEASKSTKKAVTTSRASRMPTTLTWESLGCGHLVTEFPNNPEELSLAESQQDANATWRQAIRTEEAGAQVTSDDGQVASEVAASEAGSSNAGDADGQVPTDTDMQPKLPKGWTVHYRAATATKPRKPYYWHAKSQTTQWKFPCNNELARQLVELAKQVVA